LLAQTTAMAKATLMYYNIVNFERQVEAIGEDEDIACYLHNKRKCGEHIYLAPPHFDPINNHLSGIAITCNIQEITHVHTAKSDECIKINKV
jgi:hypothetical protein